MLVGNKRIESTKYWPISYLVIEGYSEYYLLVGEPFNITIEEDMWPYIDAIANVTVGNSTHILFMQNNVNIPSSTGRANVTVPGIGSPGTYTVNITATSSIGSDFYTFDFEIQYIVLEIEDYQVYIGENVTFHLRSLPSVSQAGINVSKFSTGFEPINQNVTLVNGEATVSFNTSQPSCWEEGSYDVYYNVTIGASTYSYYLWWYFDVHSFSVSVTRDSYYHYLGENANISISTTPSQVGASFNLTLHRSSLSGPIVWNTTGTLDSLGKNSTIIPLSGLVEGKYYARAKVNSSLYGTFYEESSSTSFYYYNFSVSVSCDAYYYAPNSNANVSISTTPTQPGANFNLTLKNSTGIQWSTLGTLDSSGKNFTLIPLTSLSAGGYTVNCTVTSSVNGTKFSTDALELRSFLVNLAVNPYYCSNYGISNLTITTSPAQTITNTTIEISGSRVFYKINFTNADISSYVYCLPLVGLPNGSYSVSVTVNSSGVQYANNTWVHYEVGYDHDGDGLPDTYESQLGTSPTSWDTDGDGFCDGMELYETSNPLDPNSVPGGPLQLGNLRVIIYNVSNGSAMSGAILSINGPQSIAGEAGPDGVCNFTNIAIGSYYIKVYRSGFINYFTWVDVEAGIDTILPVYLVPTGGYITTQTITIGTTTYNIEINTTSIITGFTYNLVSFNFTVSGTTGTGSYCNITVPSALNTTALTVYLDSTPITPTITSNGTHHHVYFNYTLSTHTVAVKFASAPPPTAGTLQFTVKDASSNLGLTNVNVSITGPLNTWGLTDTNGVHTFPSIPNGTYTYLAKLTGYIDHSGTANVNPNATTHITILMAPIGGYSAPYNITVNGASYQITIETNASITAFNSNASAFSFNISGTTGTIGYCNITIPKNLNTTPITIHLDSTPISPTTTANLTHYFLHFTFALSTHQVTVSFAPPPPPEVGGGIPWWIWIIIGVIAAIVVTLIVLALKTRRPKAERELTIIADKESLATPILLKYSLKG
jgi:hypothetical protein